ncbi:hypothetical protein IEE_05500 [Bacillus cereus BAG5X1-1]|uniref:Uncharacterized protein n=1 Tax=Bacillus cereus BAG5X1-1 TaxID=1053189 RepID=J8ABN3_BACCE|nr:hypothetical protein [Bacillus cereus]EJQ36024.1 hypothetical protein IEE_05500 [Bacillus cereus BAG5X1-1]
MDNFEVVTDIQQQAQRYIDGKLGLNLEKHWEQYEIQLSEDLRVIEDIHPEMRLSLGELYTVVNKFGTEEERQELDAITKKIEPYYAADHTVEEFFESTVAKVSFNQQQNMKVECINEYVKDNHEGFEFGNSVGQALNEINYAISMAHKEVMHGDVEYKGLYPVDEAEVVYCESTGKPLQQDEEAFHIEGHGYVVPEEVNPKDVEEGNAYYTTIGYEDVEEKRIAPIQYVEEKKYEDGELRFIPTVGINADNEAEEEIYRMQSVKTIGSVKIGDGEEQVKESKINPNSGKRYLGNDTSHSEEHSHLSQEREQARKQYMMQQMNGREY